MRKVLGLLVVLAMIVGVSVFIANGLVKVAPKIAKAKLLHTVESVYEQAVEGNRPVTFKQTRRIGKLYTATALDGLTKEEIDELDRKIIFIAHSYLEYQYEINAPEDGTEDDGSWKSNVPSPFVPSHIVSDLTAT